MSLVRQTLHSLKYGLLAVNLVPQQRHARCQTLLHLFSLVGLRRSRYIRAIVAARFSSLVVKINTFHV